MTEIITTTTQTAIPEITHTVGNIYINPNKGTLYILSQVAPLQVELISLSANSNRVQESCGVEDLYNISDEVFKKYISGTMKLHLCSSISIDYTV